KFHDIDSICQLGDNNNKRLGQLLIAMLEIEPNFCRTEPQRFLLIKEMWEEPEESYDVFSCENMLTIWLQKWRVAANTPCIENMKETVFINFVNTTFYNSKNEICLILQQDGSSSNLLASHDNKRKFIGKWYENPSLSQNMETLKIKAGKINNS